MPTPSVFLSYPRASDRGGKISRLREVLEEEIRLLTGDAKFEIFQDVSMGLGQSWKQVLLERLEDASFLLPIVQPLFFTSESCRAELEAFLARERSVGRDDLVLPIYYIECEDLSPGSQDPLRRALASRQYMDCRNLRHATDEQLDEVAVKIARRIHEAFRRVSLPREPRRNRTIPSPTLANVASSPVGPNVTPNATASKLRVLLLAANPVDHDLLALGQEERLIEDELRAPAVARRVRLESAWSVTAEDFVEQLETFKPQVLHYSGHGNAQGELVLRDPNLETSRPASVRSLRQMFSGSPQLRCIVMNTCYSARLAQQLVRHLPLVVVGMRGEVEDAYALLFAEHFYRGIARGKSLREAFDGARGVVAGKGLDAADLPQINAHGNVDPEEIVLLPREATPSTASAASPWSAPVGSEEPPGYALEDLEALVKMLLSMFESGEFLRFLRFSSDTAGILPLIPTGVAAPIQVFSQAVTALAQHALIDPRFFERIVAERPRREPEIRKMQARLLRA